MPTQYFNLQGLNQYVNPLTNDGILTRAVNVSSFPLGAKSKRSGYNTFLGTLPANIQTLWSFTNDSGTTQTLYAKAGSVVYYSSQGTAAWAIAGNGTVDPNAYIGYGILNNTMIIGDGVGSTRHTTNGTSFTNTTLAPIGNSFIDYQNRMYMNGTASDTFYSTANDATNWSTSGTSDSSSIHIPGAGKVHKVFKAQDRLIAAKNSRRMFKWDGYSLVDMTTNVGPSSPQSVAQSEDYFMYINQLGLFGYGGAKPQILSNAVQRFFYNQDGSGIAGTAFASMPAEVFRYDYLAAMGTVTDDFTREPIGNALLNYNFQKNELLTHQFAHFPTCFHAYTDLTGNSQLLFGSGNQVYQLSDTATSDAGSAISTTVELLFGSDSPEYDKYWRYIRGLFNPGSQAQVSVAFTNDFRKESKVYQPLSDTASGFFEIKPIGARSKFMFLKITESSNSARWTCYGIAVDSDTQTQK